MPSFRNIFPGRRWWTTCALRVKEYHKFYTNRIRPHYCQTSYFSCSIPNSNTSLFW